jgi:hypothetical protein
MNIRKILALLLLFAVILFLSDTVQAASFAEKEAGILPGNPFYFLDTGFDSLSYSNANSAGNRAEKAVTVADERLSEMQVLYEHQDLKHIDKAKDEHDQYLTKLEENLEQVPEGELDYKQMVQIQNRINSHEKKIVALQREIEISNIELAEFEEENTQLKQTILAMSNKINKLNSQVNTRAEVEYKAQNITAEQVQEVLDEIENLESADNGGASSSSGEGSSGAGASGGSAEGVGDDQVTICHSPGANSQTMVVPNSSLSGHLGHGDTIGACVSSSSNDTSSNDTTTPTTNVTQTNQTTTNVTNTSESSDSASCSDTDGGNEFYTYGVCTVNGNATTNDYCYDSYWVHDYSCTADYECGSTGYYCPSGCRAGACVGDPSDSSDSSDGSDSNTTCVTEWVCKEATIRVYRNLDCSWGSEASCPGGCFRGECIVASDDGSSNDSRDDSGSSDVSDGSDCSSTSDDVCPSFCAPGADYDCCTNVGKCWIDGHGCYSSCSTGTGSCTERNECIRDESDGCCPSWCGAGADYDCCINNGMCWTDGGCYSC